MYEFKDESFKLWAEALQGLNPDPNDSKNGDVKEIVTIINSL
jgi:hypothetical protein